MMVGDDEVDPEFACPDSGRRAPDPTIDGHDDRDLLRREAFDGGRLESVAVSNTVGDKVHDVAAKQFQQTAEENGRCDPVHVVVAVNGDTFTPLEGPQQPVDGHGQIGQRERVVQLVESPPQGS